jgi:hypothetical protein
MEKSTETPRKNHAILRLQLVAIPLLKRMNIAFRRAACQAGIGVRTGSGIWVRNWITGQHDVCSCLLKSAAGGGEQRLLFPGRGPHSGRGLPPRRGWQSASLPDGSFLLPGDYASPGWGRGEHIYRPLRRAAAGAIEDVPQVLFTRALLTSGLPSADFAPSSAWRRCCDTPGPGRPTDFQFIQDSCPYRARMSQRLRPSWLATSPAALINRPPGISDLRGRQIISKSGMREKPPRIHAPARNNPCESVAPLTLILVAEQSAGRA